MLRIPFAPIPTVESIKPADEGGLWFHSWFCLQGMDDLIGTALFLAFSTFVLGGQVVLLGGRRFDPAELLRLVMRQGVQVAVIGILAGSAIALALSSKVQPLLFQQPQSLFFQ